MGENEKAVLCVCVCVFGCEELVVAVPGEQPTVHATVCWKQPDLQRLHPLVSSEKVNTAMFQ